MGIREGHWDAIGVGGDHEGIVRTGMRRWGLEGDNSDKERPREPRGVMRTRRS